MMPNYLTIAESAKVLKVDYKTIYRRVKSGELPSIKIGNRYRLEQSALIRALQAPLVADSLKVKVAKKKWL